MNAKEAETPTNFPGVGWAIISLSISALTYPTAFLMITIVVLPSLAFVLGALGLYKYVRKAQRPRIIVAIALTVPLFAAVATFYFWLNIVETGYRA